MPPSVLRYIVRQVAGTAVVGVALGAAYGWITTRHDA